MKTLPILRFNTLYRASRLISPGVVLVLLALASPVSGGLIAETPSMKDFQTGSQKLTVYTDVPGHTNSVINGYRSRAKSDYYEIWVRSAATDNAWVQCFANMTYNRALEMPALAGFQTTTASHAYQKFTKGWTHTYANIEMSTNSPVQVEIRKIGSTLLNSSNVIFQSAVHPAHKASNHSNYLGRVYFTITNPCQVVIDINGQMDDHNAAYSSSTPGGAMPGNPPVHSLAFYANPIMAKPVSSPTNTILTVTPDQSTPTTRLIQPDPATYDTLVFAPGVHFIGPGFKLYPGRSYYIPGDAIVYGNIGNSGVSGIGYRCNGDRINIFGYGTLCGIQIPHYQNDSNNPEYPEWNAWVGGKGQGVGVQIENAWDTKLTGITIADPANFNTSWGMQSGRTNDRGLVSWVKLHSWRVNGDGFGGYQSVEDSFIRACDDSTYVRSWRKRCTFWKDTNANIFRFINFISGGLLDCDVLYARWRDPRGVGSVFEFDSGGTPEVIPLNILIKDVRFHDKLSNPRHLFSMAATASYSGIKFENISAYVPKNGYKSVLQGSALAPWYEDIIFKNVTYKTNAQDAYDPGTLLTATNFGTYFETNEFVNYLLFDDPRNLTLTVNATNGVVTKSPSQTNYLEMSIVTLTAVPDAGFEFMGWTGVPAVDVLKNPITFRMTDNKTITANFGPAIFIVNQFTNPGTFNWVCPSNITQVIVECRGGGGAGGTATRTTTTGNAISGGGAGGGYAKTTLTVIPGTTNKVIVGAGGVSLTNVTVDATVNSAQRGGASMFANFNLTTTNCLAVGGAGGTNALKSGATDSIRGGGLGSTAGAIGDVIFRGGSGGNGATSGGGGGGGAGNQANAADAGNTNAKGLGGFAGGGDGSDGRGNGAANNSAAAGSAPGGGGGGAKSSSTGVTNRGGSGGAGMVTLTCVAGLHHFTVTAGTLQTSGVPFNVTITAQDAANATVPRTLDNLTLTSPGSMEFDWNGDGIYGDNSGILPNGTVTIKARNKFAETVTIVAEATSAAGNFTTTNPPSITTVVGEFIKLQILVPGETAAPNTPTGKTGTPSPRRDGAAFYVTVNAVDISWNPVSSTHTIDLSSTDGSATLPADAPLIGGTRQFVVKLNSVGSFTLTATDVTDGTKTAATTPALTVLENQTAVWQGDDDLNLWDTEALNWTNTIPGEWTTFSDGNFVVFDDTSANPLVELVGVVTPGSITVISSNNYTFSSTNGGYIGGPNGLGVFGTGILTLATSNTFGGAIFITNTGAIRATANQALGFGGITMGNNSGQMGRLELAGGITLSNAITLHARLGDAPGQVAIQNLSDTNFLSGPITLAMGGSTYRFRSDAGLLTLGTPGALAIAYITGTRGVLLQGDGDGFVAGNITGGDSNGHLTKEGAGTWTLAGANTYNVPTVITAGVLKLGTNNAIPNGSGKGSVTLNAVLDLNGFSDTINGLTGTGTVEGGSGAPTFTVGDNNSSSTFGGVIQNSGGTLNLVKTGTGTLTLTNVHPFTGTVAVNSGTLTLTGAAAFPNATVLAVATNGTLNVSGLPRSALNLAAHQTLRRSGSAVGPIKITGNLTNGPGQILLELHRAQSPATNDSLAVSGTFTPGGMLTVTNIGPALVPGDSFRLFSAGASGFAAVNLPTNDALNNVAYTWSNTISSNGRIAVAKVVNLAAPRVQMTLLSNNTALSLAWPGNAGWTLLTNSAGLTETNQWFPYPNSANLTNLIIPIDSSTPRVFFKMKYPYP